jgi:hypothetical protein
MEKTQKKRGRKPLGFETVQRNFKLSLQVDAIARKLSKRYDVSYTCLVEMALVRLAEADQSGVTREALEEARTKAIEDAKAPLHARRWYGSYTREELKEQRELRAYKEATMTKAEKKAERNAARWAQLRVIEEERKAREDEERYERARLERLARETPPEDLL